MIQRCLFFLTVFCACNPDKPESNTTTEGVELDKSHGNESCSASASVEFGVGWGHGGSISKSSVAVTADKKKHDILKCLKEKFDSECLYYGRLKILVYPNGTAIMVLFEPLTNNKAIKDCLSSGWKFKPTRTNTHTHITIPIKVEVKKCDV